MNYVKRLFEILLHFFFPVSCYKCGKPGTKLCDECKKKEAEHENDIKAIKEQADIEKLIDEAVTRAVEKIVSQKFDEALTKILDRIELEKSTPQKITTQPEEKSITAPKDEEYIKFLFEKEPIEKYIGKLHIYSAALYYSNVREIIFDFKYKGNKLLCRYLGRAMSKFFPKPEADYIIPVPLHIDSKRGYNQAFELAKGMSEIWKIRSAEVVQWAKIIPDRIGLTAQERKKLSTEDFRVTHKIKGLRLVIVDDVSTTGTTLLRMSQVLENSGAIVVCAYALAFTNE